MKNKARLALLVLVFARCFADEHQPCVGIADAEYDLPAAERVQLAARAVRTDRLAQRRQRLGGSEGGGAGRGHVRLRGARSVVRHVLDLRLARRCAHAAMVLTAPVRPGAVYATVPRISDATRVTA